MKIMLVDDSRTIRNIEKNTLAQLGYTDTVEAGDGVEALSLISNSMPHLFLVDWNMPNMDGLTLVKNIRVKNHAVPIIMVTTEAEKAHVFTWGRTLYSNPTDGLCGRSRQDRSFLNGASSVYDRSSM